MGARRLAAPRHALHRAVRGRRRRHPGAPDRRSRLSHDLAATFIVENRTGAGGAIGAQAVVQWPADGTGFLFTSSSVAILPALRANLGFDPLHDLP